MLDFSFSEVGLVGLVALIAIGPERMPKVARGAGVLFGRFRRYSQSVKAEIDRELHLAEMKEVERKIADARTEAARQIAASAAAVDGVLKQPLLTETSTSPATSSALAAQPDVASSGVDTVDEWLAGDETQDASTTLERPKVGYAQFGGDPFSVRRAAPQRSLSRDSGQNQPVHEARESS